MVQKIFPAWKYCTISVHRRRIQFVTDDQDRISYQCKLKIWIKLDRWIRGYQWWLFLNLRLVVLLGDKKILLLLKYRKKIINLNTLFSDLWFSNSSNAALISKIAQNINDIFKLRNKERRWKSLVCNKFDYVRMSLFSTPFLGSLPIFADLLVACILLLLWDWTNWTARSYIQFPPFSLFSCVKNPSISCSFFSQRFYELATRRAACPRK